ncbi:MAG: peptidylprolyl isomerase [Nanoarchaeota archaeon]|nr:peptidylprolyl isomerase [Nanoarchaeota archaeon]
MAIKKGDIVKVEYTGTLDDGTVFDTSKGKAPLEFKVGEGRIIKGFEEAVIGMEKGEEKEVRIPPEKAYGDPNPELIAEVPREQFPKDMELKEGMIISIDVPNLGQLPATITKVDDEKVTIDLNPPLAGKTLNFKIKVVDVIIS